jgi:hypothetical protein
MISKCANPDCSAAFDHRAGRFFCFRRAHAPNEPPPNSHSVWHFWLCGDCSETLILDDRGGVVQVSPRWGYPIHEEARRRVAAA